MIVFHKILLCSMFWYACSLSDQVLFHCIWNCCIKLLFCTVSVKINSSSALTLHCKRMPFHSCINSVFLHMHFPFFVANSQVWNTCTWKFVLYKCTKNKVSMFCLNFILLPYIFVWTFSYAVAIVKVWRMLFLHSAVLFTWGHCSAVAWDQSPPWCS